MNQEKFKLHWHTYTDHLKEMLHDMMSSNELTDVTLVSDDKVHFKAHKVVLSACSPTFKSIVSDNHLTNQSIFLRGIQSHEVESILHFIYLGQATFYQDHMNEFLNVARSLEIKEISRENPENENIEETKELPTVNAEPWNLEDNVIKQRPIKPKLNVVAPHDSNKACFQCEKIFYDKSTLNKHVRMVHEGVKYPCDQCNHKATQLSNLQQHIKSVHEGVKYPCYQCDYKATQPNHLRQHMKSVHEGVKYQCDQCNHEASQLFDLQQHINSIHEGVRYPCDHCDSKFIHKNSLNRHRKSAHEAC